MKNECVIRQHRKSYNTTENAIIHRWIYSHVEAYFDRCECYKMDADVACEWVEMSACEYNVSLSVSGSQYSCNR